MYFCLDIQRQLPAKWQNLGRGSRWWGSWTVTRQTKWKRHVHENTEFREGNQGGFCFTTGSWSRSDQQNLATTTVWESEPVTVRTYHIPEKYWAEPGVAHDHPLPVPPAPNPPPVVWGEYAWVISGIWSWKILRVGLVQRFSTGAPL